MSSSTTKAQGKKRKFKLPHLLFLMLGLILFMSLMTYIIPAGEFATDPETGEILGDQFSFLPEQTPVSPWDALLSILPGFQNSSLVIALVLIAGGAIGVVMETGALIEHHRPRRS